jgi:hypothetical protein
MARLNLRSLLLACAAATLPAGSACAAFVDRGGGIIYDTASGLDWEQQPGAAWIDYAGANAYVAGLALDGGGWLMPTIQQLTDLNGELIALTGCFDCSGDWGPFSAIPLGVWTTATYFAGQPGAFYVSFYRPATTIGLFQTSQAGVWAVRAGAPIPEPGSFGLAGLALLVLATEGRRRKKA